MTEAETIAAGERVKLFLKDDAIVGALAGLNRKYFDEFKTSKTPAEREAVWAKARAIEDFGTALEATLTNGAHAANDRAVRERNEKDMKARNTTGTTRKGY